MARRSRMVAGSRVGVPDTCERKPCSTKDESRAMPLLASLSEARTSLVLLPMEETMPIPVTTTRRMRAS